MKESLLPLIPRSVPNCEAAMMIAAAFEKPQITGMLIKSTRKPSCNIPIAVIMHPDKKDIRTCKTNYNVNIIYKTCYNDFLRVYTKLFYIRKFISEN